MLPLTQELACCASSQDWTSCSRQRNKQVWGSTMRGGTVSGLYRRLFFKVRTLQLSFAASSSRVRSLSMLVFHAGEDI